MGELIEISIISHKDNIADKMLCFMEKVFDMHNGIQRIEVMDNWCYENAFCLTSLDEIKSYIDSKIITLTKNSLTEQIGVMIEHSLNYYYHFWYNPEQEFSESEYRNSCNIFADYIIDKRKDDILMCGIGREISVNFDMSIEEIIQKSHNIDLWIIKTNLVTNCKLENIKEPKVILI